MPRTVDKLKAIKVKAALRKGKSAREALRLAGYGKGHIGRSTANKVVRDSIKFLSEEFKATDLTANMIITGLIDTISKASTKGDYSTVRAAWETLGKYLALWKDKQDITHREALTDSQIEDFEAIRKTYEG